MTPTAADSPLATAIGCAVPLRILEYQARGGPTDADRERVRGSAQIIAEQGDRLMYRGNAPGDAARLFNALADGLAVLAFCPGGVRFCGTRYEAQRTEEAT